MRYDEREPCAFHPRPAAPWVASFVPPGRWASNAHLTSGEIVEQVLYFARKLQQQRMNGDQYRHHGHGRAISQL